MHGSLKAGHRSDFRWKYVILPAGDTDPRVGATGITGHAIPIVSVHEEQCVSSLRVVGTSGEQSSWREDEREESNIITSTSKPLGTKPNSPVPARGLGTSFPSGNAD